MKIFKRYVIRDKTTKQILDTVVVENGKPRPKVKPDQYIAECIGKYEKPEDDKNNG